MRDGGINGTPGDGGNRASGRGANLRVDDLEITEGAKGIPEAIEVENGEQLLACLDLDLKGVGELPPALDDAATLAVIRARMDEARAERGEGVGELLGAIDGAGVGVRDPGHAKGEECPQQRVPQRREILGEVPPVCDGESRRVVDEGTELCGGGATVGTKDLGTVVVIADPEISEVVKAHLDGGLRAEDDELAPGSAATAEVTVEGGAVRSRGQSDGALATQDVDHGAGPSRGQLAAQDLRPVERFLAERAQRALVFAVPRTERVDPALTIKANPRPQRARRDGDLASMAMGVPDGGPRCDARTQRINRVLVQERRDDPISEERLVARFVVVSFSVALAHTSETARDGIAVGGALAGTKRCA